MGQLNQKSPIQQYPQPYKQQQNCKINGIVKNGQELHLMFSEWVEALAEIDCTKLRKLSLCNYVIMQANCSVTDFNVYKITQYQMPKLQWLWLNQNQITQFGIDQIASQQWPRLQILNLDYNKFGSKGIQMLVRSNFIYLKQLRIEFCNIGQSGCKHLTKGNWYHLQGLYIGGNRIRLSGTIQIINKRLKNLKHLQLMNFSTEQPFIISNLFFVMLQCYYTSINDHITNYKIEKDLKRIFKKRFYDYQCDIQQD